MVAEELLKKLSSGGKLPTPPGVVLKILNLAERADATIGELTDIIALDPALSAKILRFANSPMSGVSREITSLRQAVALMGMRGVKMMALSFSLVTSAKQNPCALFNCEHYQIYATACAAAAKVLAEVTGTASPQESFSGGLLSQLGRSILAASLPDEYAKVIARAERIPTDLPPIERQILGSDYAAVGAAVLASWKLPASLCASVEEMHASEGGQRSSALARILVVAERAADVVCPDKPDRALCTKEFVAAAQTQLELADEVTLSALSTIASEVDAVRKSLEVPKGSLRSPADVENDIRERIAELSLAMHLENQNMAQQQEELMRRATTDALTGVGNRAAFDARLSLELERGMREGGSLALLIVDVDRFKNFNDQFGHQIGDQVLVAVARVLDHNVRKIDFTARFGGEEFAVVAPNTPPQQAVQLAERLRKAIAAAVVSTPKGKLGVTASIGVAVISDVNGPATDAVKLVESADDALYKAKRNGRNVVELAGRLPQVAAK